MTKPQIAFGIAARFERWRPKYKEDGLPLKKKRVGQIFPSARIPEVQFDRPRESSNKSVISLSWMP